MEKFNWLDQHPQPVLYETRDETICDFYFDKLLLEYCAFKDKGGKCPYNNIGSFIVDFALWAATKRYKTFKFSSKADTLKFMERVHERFPVTFPSYVDLVKSIEDIDSSIANELKDIELANRRNVDYSSYRELISSEFRNVHK